ncbi:MAG TPA: hypothetical protein VFT54_10100 [Acidimicrobiia bacterium]|nr:hypothetical protein [Acidimicrobiia bacterium]
MQRLYRTTFDRLDLADRFPARFTSPNKKAFLEMVEGAPIPGSIDVARWAAVSLPTERSGRRPELVTKVGYFTYEPDTESVMQWHLNFANFDLFSAYAGSLLAQDEMQVLEHPDLARVRHALLGEGLSTLVTDRAGPTPFTLTAVPRRGAIETAPGSGRPGGLYGNRFAAAPVDQVLAATTVIKPPTLSNIVAMEAPAYGRGEYTSDEITGILTAAVTGFGAAVAETERIAPGSRTVIHTGWWGCGAYGGNQELMALLQLVAAEWAEVNEVAFHIGSADSEPILQRARQAQESLPETTPELVAAIADRRYQWGVSDGN